MIFIYYLHRNKKRNKCCLWRYYMYLFFPVLFKSEQSALGITSQVEENHSSRDLHRRPCRKRGGLAVGRPRWRQWKERKGGFLRRKEMQISLNDFLFCQIRHRFKWIILTQTLLKRAWPPSVYISVRPKILSSFFILYPIFSYKKVWKYLS